MCGKSTNQKGTNMKQPCLVNEEVFSEAAIKGELESIKTLKEVHYK
jgi:hypothetical protein